MLPALRAFVAFACIAILTAQSAALPGDCTAIEMGSYLVDPRTISTITSQPFCTGSNTGNTGCADVQAPQVWSGSEIYSAEQAAARDTCDAVPYPGCGPDTVPCPVDSNGEELSWCTYYNADYVFQPDQTMIETKAAAIALSSPECATCAAGFLPRDEHGQPTTNCVVNADHSCAHDSEMDYGCVVGAELIQTPNYETLANVYAYQGCEHFTSGMCQNCLGWSSLSRCKLGSGNGKFPDMCQWDGSQPEGRRCTIKPEHIAALAVQVKCHMQTYQLGTSPSSASDCSAVAPWCKYKTHPEGDYCETDSYGSDGADLAIAAATADIPCDVAQRPGATPSPSPPPSPSADSTSSSNGLLITVLAVVALAAVATTGALMFRKRASAGVGDSDSIYNGKPVDGAGVN